MPRQHHRSATSSRRQHQPGPQEEPATSAQQEPQQQEPQRQEPQRQQRKRARPEPDSDEPQQEQRAHGRGPSSPSPSTQAADASCSSSDEEGEVAAAEHDLPELSLQVLWTSVSGRTKLTQLPLVLMPRWDCTSGLHKRLVARVFSESERPASLTCTQYLQFNTSEECLNYPLDIARTSFRLVASHEGWQYVIHESPQHPPGVPPDFLHVVSIEFETVARVIGHLGIRMSMIAYPIVAINKAKLMDVVVKMRTDGDFKGIL